MFDNLTLIIVIIVLFWLATFGFYLFTSRQQRDIANDLERLQKKLDESNDQD